MHTVHSDGRLQPKALIEQAITIGLKGLRSQITILLAAISSSALVRKLEVKTPLENSAPHLWSGVEINANLGIEVHILGYAFDLTALHYLQRQAASGEVIRQPT